MLWFLQIERKAKKEKMVMPRFVTLRVSRTLSSASNQAPWGKEQESRKEGGDGWFLQEK